MATVTIAQGALKGGKSTTDSGFEYFEFLGIPYAKPPVGELRFKSPQSAEPWTGVRDATTTDSTTTSCQVDFMTGSIKGSEDCLYLNVYTPKLPAANTEPKSVIVFFHGGGFISGNGTLKEENGPDYLIENDVVVVAVNYRLGPLGFLNLGIPEAAGNLGLKDQVKALEWIQNNIDKFGGDRSNVTLFGASAGSAACDFLLLSPLAKGLFHKCILQSASCLNNWTINSPNKSKSLAVKLAQGLGYTGPDDDMNGVYKILFSAPAPQLTGLALQIAEKETSQGISFGFVPSLEQDFGNGDAFLTDSPYKNLKEGSFNTVPVLRGFCNKEGTLVSAMKPLAVKELAETKSFTDYWSYALDNSDVIEYQTKLKSAYIDNGSGDKCDDFAVNFLGDLSIVAGIYLTGKLQSKKMPVYMYKFCYDGQLNVFKIMFGLMKPGAAHGDDSGYLFRHVGLSSRIPDDADILMRNRMSKMWTNFAKTGNPTPDNCPELPVQWPLFTEESQQYLNIDKELTVEANYEPAKMAIFEEVMDKYEQ